MKRKKYKSLKDLPGCPKGTEFYAPGNSNANVLFPDGKNPIEDCVIMLPFDHDWFIEDGSANEFTWDEMVRFATATSRKDKAEVEAALNNLTGAGLFGDPAKFKKE